MKKGIIFASTANILWCLLPLYLKLLQDVAPIEILLHRMIWSLVFVVIILSFKRHFTWLNSVIRSPKIILTFALSAFCIALNWFTYIWAVNSNHVVDASLGYFIAPLMNVIMGYFLLQERMRATQWFAIAVAAFGVLWLIVQAGQIPWIAFVLATTFGLYGLLRKTAKLESLEGLSLETAILAPFALVWLISMSYNNQSSFILGSGSTKLLLMLAGPITAIPLLFFSAATRRIPLYLLGLLQYVTPTGQMLLGLVVWHEPFSADKVIGFAIIWTSLAIYSAESVWFHKKLIFIPTATFKNKLNKFLLKKR